MSKNINVRIALKRDTSANWTNYNPVLLNGELILVDTAEGQLRAKIGDGIKTYTQLPFTDEALRALITEVDNNNSAVVVTKNGESRLLDTFNIVKLTQEEYEELKASNSLNPDALYLTEGGSENIGGSKVVLTQNGVGKELPVFNIVKLSEEEYRQLIDSNTLDPDTLYLTEGSGAGEGTQVVLSDLIAGTEPENLSVLNIIRLSQEEYDALVTSNSLDPKAIYMTEAANGGNTDELKTYIDNADATTLNSAKTYSDNNFLKLSGGTVTGVTTFTNTTASTSTTTGAVKISGGLGVAGDIYANKVYGAVWNDYAECRESNEFIDAGRVVKENGDDTLSLADGRLIYGCSIVSDTFGFMIGETDKAHTPIAVSGRVLAYPYENREVFRHNIGCFVCSGPNGTVSLMDKEEVWNHPEAIIGQVSAVPDYEYWGNDVKINGRVWIKVR